MKDLDYKEKYLKYKTKYLKLKEKIDQSGGVQKPKFTIDSSKVAAVTADIQQGLPPGQTVTSIQKPNMFIWETSTPRGTVLSHTTVHTAQTPGGTRVLGPNIGASGSVHTVSEHPRDPYRTPIFVNPSSVNTRTDLTAPPGAPRLQHRTASSTTSNLAYASASAFQKHGLFQPYQSKQ